MPVLSNGVEMPVLSNGVEMPVFALGTWRMTDEQAFTSVMHALSIGYRHVDTAEVYRNEAGVGRAIRESKLPREEVFVTTKLSPRWRGAEAIVAACTASLERLGLDFVDCYLVHWPGVSKIKSGSHIHAEARLDIWAAMCQLLSRGLCRSIGVSNYTTDHMEQIRTNLQPGQVLPMVNQIEMHPAFPQHDLRKWCHSHGCMVAAYSPLGTGHLLTDPTVQNAAEQAGRSPSQVLLKWALQTGAAVVVKSASQERLAENLLSAAAPNLDEPTLRILDTIASKKFCWDPSVVS